MTAVTPEICESSAVPVEVFEIYLHREEYFPGDIVTGKLLVMMTKQVQTQGIYIKFEGRGHAKWEKRPAYLCGLQEAQFVEGKQHYFVNVFRYDLKQLPIGSSAFPFEFELPTNLPPSIFGLKNIKIWYAVEALIRTPTEDYRQRKLFEVQGILNLIAFPELSLPMCKTVRQPMYESCWSACHIVLLSFIVRKQGFVPGELVKADLIVKHSDCVAAATTTTASSRIQILLIQELELRVTQGSRTTRKVLARNDTTKISKMDGKTNKFSFLLKIPDDIFISFETKSQQDFISIRYLLRISMEATAFPYKPFQLNIPIKIGSIKINDHLIPFPPTILSAVPPSRKKVVKTNVDLGDSPHHHHHHHALPVILVEESSQTTTTKVNQHGSPWRRQAAALTAFNTSTKGTSSSSAVRDSCGSLSKPHEAFTEYYSSSLPSDLQT